LTGVAPGRNGASGGIVRFNPVEGKKFEIREWPISLPPLQQGVWIFGVETQISTTKID
jgi:hypothetical protein